MAAPVPMSWSRLLSARRITRRDGRVALDPAGPGGGRSPFQVDVDRIIFSSAFRRLQNKTQVHPLSDNDHVHTRLTHTIEVASVGQSLGLSVGADLCADLGAAISPAEIGYMVQAACLAHDIGNPPFGHCGEEAIRDWFATAPLAREDLSDLLSATQLADLRHFEGNAQGFRILTALEMYRHEGGLRLTCGTLGAFMKYPRGTDTDKLPADGYVGGKKPGYYWAEAAIARTVAEECGLPTRGDWGGCWARHPLVYLVEAADDICYSVVDLEDGWELGCVDFAAVEAALAPIARHPGKYGPDAHARLVDLRAEAWYADKTDAEKIGFLRGKAIGNLIAAASAAFRNQQPALLAGTLDRDLLAYTEFGDAARACKRLAVDRIYNAAHVLPIEMAGFEVLHGLLDAFIGAAVDWHRAGCDPRRVKPQTRRMVKLLGPKLHDAPDLYSACLVVMDYIAGMTDRYAVSLFRKLQGITL